MWDSIISFITEVNGAINSFVWGWPVIIMILGTGLLLSVRSGFLQLRKFGDSLKSTIVPTLKGIGKEKKTDKNARTVSQFEAFSAAISGTVGTGNIIGVTSAILTGGPGAVVWMWISAFFGMITNYAENVLGLFYRQKDEEGNFCGGAFYYITFGLRDRYAKNQKWLRVLFSILGYLAAFFCMIAAVGMSGVQANKITGTMASVFRNEATSFKIIVGAIVALLAAVVIIGGIKRIGKIASMIVPFMSLIFILCAIIIIIMNAGAIPEAFRLIFTSVFSAKAVAGGVGGFVFSTVIKKGMARGVFSNEAGLGSSVIAHSASETKEPVMQGLWGIFEVFFDTFIICTLTALVILTTYVGSGAYADGSFFALSDSAAALSAFGQNLGIFGTIGFSIILPLFAYTTILAWSYYGEKATEFCFHKRSIKARKIAVTVFKFIFVLLIVASAVIESNLIWDIDDTFNGLMALPNLIAVILLSGQVIRITKNYYDRKKGEAVEPMLSAYPDLNEEFKKDLQ